ncbi:MAG TPA: iron-containing redox enzyme family protein [candidate division Zixibacteria bacterium]|nr:iron-containing redox enzyme family protein [candidate division Zixibacteria bacterium]
MIDSLHREIIGPGVAQLMSTRFFSELREGKLSRKRLQGFALQHYLSNHAINKGLAFCMVRNANHQPVYDQFVELFVEETSHPGLMKRFGEAIGLRGEDFDDAVMIFECVAHTGAIIRGMFLGTLAEARAGALVNETMVRRYSEVFDAALERHYGLDARARAFFTVHARVDEHHTAMAAEVIARHARTPRDHELVRAAARNMVRFKIAKFDGIYDAYG